MMLEHLARKVRAYIAIITAIAAVVFVLNPIAHAQPCASTLTERVPGDPTFRDGAITIGFAEGEEPSIGEDAANHWLIAWRSLYAGGSPNGIYAMRYNRNGNGNPWVQTGADCPLQLTDAAVDADFGHVSVFVGHATIAGGGDSFTAAWTAQRPGLPPAIARLDPSDFRLSVGSFEAGPNGYPQLPTPTPPGGGNEFNPSAAVAGGFHVVGLSATLVTDEQRGLNHDLRGSGPTTIPTDRIRCCDDASPFGCPLEVCNVQAAQWQPCVSMRDDGVYCVVWAEKEDPGFGTVSFNIALRIYDLDNNLLARVDRDAAVRSINQPERERPDSDQVSPSVSLDDCGNLCVVWAGQTLPGEGPGVAVYTRRLHFDDLGDGDPNTNRLTFLSDAEVVNTVTDWDVGFDPGPVNPTVELANTDLSSWLGRHVIAWNATVDHPTGGPSQRGVRARLYSPAGHTVGEEFDLTPNPDPADAETFDGVHRTLAESAQHTVS